MKVINFDELKRQAESVYAPDGLKDKIRERCHKERPKMQLSINWKPAVAFVCVIAVMIFSFVWNGRNSKDLSLIVYAKGEDGEMYETVVGEEGAEIYTSANEYYGIKQEWADPEYCKGVYWIDESVSVLDCSFFLENSDLKKVTYTIKNENVYFAEEFKTSEVPAEGEDSSIDERYYKKKDGFKNNGARFYTYLDLGDIEWSEPFYDEEGRLCQHYEYKNGFDPENAVYGIVWDSVLELSYEEQSSRTYKLAVYENQVFDKGNPLQIRIDYTYNDGESGSFEIYMTENIDKSEGSKRYLNVMCMVINTSN